MTSQRILTGHVHRLINGVTESYGPGDVAPDWVDNPKLIAAAATEPEPVEPDGTVTPNDPPTTPSAPVDDLDGLSASELKAIADELGVAKSGSKAEITGRIRAKRAEENNTNDDDDDRAALVEKVIALGYEADDSLSEAELQALIEQAG